MQYSNSCLYILKEWALVLNSNVARNLKAIQTHKYFTSTKLVPADATDPYEQARYFWQLLAQSEIIHKQSFHVNFSFFDAFF